MNLYLATFKLSDGIVSKVIIRAPYGALAAESFVTHLRSQGYSPEDEDIECELLESQGSRCIIHHL